MNDDEPNRNNPNYWWRVRNLADAAVRSCKWWQFSTKRYWRETRDHADRRIAELSAW